MASEHPVDVPTARRSRVRDAAAQEIKATARIHLARSGPADLSLRAVARDVGVAPSALYRYFESRAALVAALSADSLNAAADAMGAALSGAAGSGAAQVRASFLALRNWARANPAEFDLILANRDRETRPDVSTSPELQRLLGIPAAAVATGIEDGTIDARTVTSDLLAQCLGWLYLEHFGLVHALPDETGTAYAAYLDGLLGRSRG